MSVSMEVIQGKHVIGVCKGDARSQIYSLRLFCVLTVML
jgi:hypothetical protein